MSHGSTRTRSSLAASLGLALSLAGLAGLSVGVAAQSPAPAAQSPAPAAQSPAPAAAVGSPVTYIDSQGVTRGTVTIAKLFDPFLEYAEGSAPPDGMRYVLLQAVFEAALDQPYDVQPYQIVLRDTNGGLWSPSYVPRPQESIVIPDFQGQTMAPGNRISGMIGFQVPADAQIKDVLYEPESARIITAEQLASGGPAAGTPVVDTFSDGSTASITAQVTDPFTGFDPNYPPPEGQRFVLASIVFEDTGNQVYPAAGYTLLLRTADGYAISPSYVYRPEGQTVPDLDSQNLAPGDRISGVVGFAVPENAVVASIEYNPEYQRLVTLADMSGAGGATSPAPSPASASPEASAGTGR